MIGLFIITLSFLAAHRDTHSYLIFGVAEQLLLGLHEANCRDGTCVLTEDTNWLRGNIRVPQQDLMIHTCCGYNQSERIQLA